MSIKKQTHNLKEDLTAKVRKGMDYLDKTVPGWEHKIDLRRLELENPQVCVCGQLFGDFWAKVRGDASAGARIQISDMEKFGFYIENNEDGDYELLTRIWHKKIKELRKARLAVRV